VYFPLSFSHVRILLLYLRVRCASKISSVCVLPLLVLFVCSRDFTSPLDSYFTLYRTPGRLVRFYVLARHCCAHSYIVSRAPYSSPSNSPETLTVCSITASWQDIVRDLICTLGPIVTVTRTTSISLLFILAWFCRCAAWPMDWQDCSFHSDN
jgi:hypothetical protein